MSTPSKTVALRRQCHHCGVSFMPREWGERFCDVDCEGLNKHRVNRANWRDTDAYANAVDDDARRKWKEGELLMWRELPKAGKAHPNPTSDEAFNALEAIAKRVLTTAVVLDCTDPRFDFEKVPEGFRDDIVLPSGVRVKDATEEQFLQAERWVEEQQAQSNHE